jgi:hypothetical protein
MPEGAISGREKPGCWLAFRVARIGYDLTGSISLWIRKEAEKMVLTLRSYCRVQLKFLNPFSSFNHLK